MPSGAVEKTSVAQRKGTCQGQALELGLEYGLQTPIPELISTPTMSPLKSQPPPTLEAFITELPPGSPRS